MELLRTASLKGGKKPERTDRASRTAAVGPELAEGHKGRCRLCRPVPDRLTLASLGALTGRQRPGTACGPGPLASAGLRPREHGKFEPSGKPPGPCTGYAEHFKSDQRHLRPPGLRSFPLCRLLPYIQTLFLKAKKSAGKACGRSEVVPDSQRFGWIPCPVSLDFPWGMV